MGTLNKLHIAGCSLEVVGDATYSYFLDRLEVIPDWDVEEWEFSDGKAGQNIGDTRLFFGLDWSYFEGALGETATGHVALVKKFMDLEEVNLIPDFSQPADKFKVLLDFSELKQLALIEKGKVRRGVQLPLKTQSRLTAAQLQFFNFI